MEENKEVNQKAIGMQQEIKRQLHSKVKKSQTTNKMISICFLFYWLTCIKKLVNFGLFLNY